jgi:DNA-binding IclR family transcriptional regulator
MPAMSTEANDASGSDIQAVVRAGQVCALFGPETRELTAVEVSERLGLNRTTAYRYCSSLVTAGILDRGGRRGTFVLGGLMVQLGIHALGTQRVLDVAPPHLVRLRSAVRITIVLSLWGARGPVVAMVEEDVSRQAIVTVHAGAQLDLAASQTHVFLAYRDYPRTLGAIAEDLSPEDAAALHAAVEEVRATGMGVAQHAGALAAAAVPVFDDQGICATIALLGSAEMVDSSPGSRQLADLRAAAAALGDELRSGRPEPAVADVAAAAASGAA